LPQGWSGGLPDLCLWRPPGSGTEDEMREPVRAKLVEVIAERIVYFYG